MGLPIQSTPTYTCVLPASGEEIKYRPFLVKEQKVLTIARESESQKQIFEAVKSLLESVTFNKVTVDKLAVIDMEYLFLKVRTVSVGETSKVSTQCDGDDCDGRVELLVNLEEIDVIGTEVDPKIMINDEVGVILSPPNVANIGNLEGTDDDALEIIQRSIVSVFDQESSYEASEMSNKDMKEFIESLTFKQLELLTNYFEELPKLSHTVEGTCNKCSEVTSRTLEGLNSFF